MQKTYTVIEIYEADFGCEERPEGQETMVGIRLKAEDGEEIHRQEADAELYAKNIINIIAFIMYGIDKWKAHRKQWRISEKMLLFLAVIGGSAGALAGMYIFHHKTLHKKFTIGVPLILVIQVMIFICIMENFYR